MQVPFLEFDSRESEHGPGTVQAYCVYAQDILQVRFYFTQHLVDIHNLDRGSRGVETQFLAELVNDGGMDSSLESSSKINRDFIGFFMAACGRNSFS